MDLQIIQEYGRLMSDATPKDRVDAYLCIRNAAFSILAVRNKHESNFELMHDGELLFQMTSLKCQAILSLIEGFELVNPFDGLQFKHTTDPFSLIPIVRSQFEAYSTFNNLFVNHSEEEQLLVYNLWVISGLKYRQLYAANLPKTVEKQQSEKKQIESITLSIRESEAYKRLCDKERSKIDSSIKDKKWQLKIENDKVSFLSWKQMFEGARLHPNAFNEIYPYLSLGTHPSNVSVFQFRELYKTGEHYSSTLFAMQISKFIIAFFIRDYCELFPAAKSQFNNLPVIAQLLINSLNSAMRGQEFRLNSIEETV